MLMRDVMCHVPQKFKYSVWGLNFVLPGTAAAPSTRAGGGSLVCKE